MKNDKSDEPFFPPYSSAKKAIPLPDSSQSKELRIDDPDFELSLELQVERLVISSRVGSILRQIQELEPDVQEYVQKVLKETGSCPICKNESRPNHMLKVRMRKEWLISGVITEAIVQTIESILDSADQGLGQKYYLAADVVEELQRLFSSASPSEDRGIFLGREISKRRRAMGRLADLNVLVNMGVHEKN